MPSVSGLCGGLYCVCCVVLTQPFGEGRGWFGSGGGLIVCECAPGRSSCLCLYVLV